MKINLKLSLMVFVPTGPILIKPCFLINIGSMKKLSFNSDFTGIIRLHIRLYVNRFPRLWPKI